ncbi:MAG: deaminase [Clostridia bacterium]|nr:deaminase [Clostridia bacterium]
MSHSDIIYYIREAFKEAEKSNCPRTKVGCILVKNHTILTSACNNEILNLNKCSIEGCIRIIKGVSSGSNLDLCRGIHAEQKLLINCALNNINPVGATIYLTHSPCFSCAKILIEAGISELYYCIDYPDTMFKKLFDEIGLKYIRVGLEEI